MSKERTNEWFEHAETQIVDQCVFTADQISCLTNAFDCIKNAVIELEKEYDLDYKNMVRAAVLQARPESGLDSQERWACVSRMLAVGSYTAFELCEKFGVDPYDKIEN